MPASLGQTSVNNLWFGRYTFVSFKSSAASGEGTNLTGLKAVSAEPESDEEEVFQLGGGDTPLLHQTGEKWNLTATVEGADVATLAALRAVTLGAAGQYGLSMASDGAIKGYLEKRVYEETGATLLLCMVYPDVIIRNYGLAVEMDRNENDVSMVTYEEPYLLKDLDASSTKYPAAYHDAYNGDGATVDFSLTKVPLTIDTANLNNQYAFFVKVDGVRIISGYTILDDTGWKLRFDTAPVAGTNNVEILYAYDTEA